MKDEGNLTFIRSFLAMLFPTFFLSGGAGRKHGLAAHCPLG